MTVNLLLENKIMREKRMYLNYKKIGLNRQDENFKNLLIWNHKA